MQPGQSVAQKFTKTTCPFKDDIVIFLPSMVVKVISGACFLSFKLKNRMAKRPITMMGIQMLFIGLIVTLFDRFRRKHL